jgi:hypothetical protein
MPKLARFGPKVRLNFALRRQGPQFESAWGTTENSWSEVICLGRPNRRLRLFATCSQQLHDRAGATRDFRAFKRIYRDRHEWRACASISGMRLILAKLSTVSSVYLAREVMEAHTERQPSGSPKPPKFLGDPLRPMMDCVGTQCQKLPTRNATAFLRPSAN